MKAYTNTFKYGIKQISRDYMLALLLFAPILAGTAFKFLIPVVNEMISDYYHVDKIIQPYYPILDGILIYLAPSMFCTIFGFIMLEERDDRVAPYLMVTPIGYSGYILARLILPAIVAWVFSFGVIMTFKLTDMSMLLGLTIGILSTLYAVSMTLIVVSKAKNKVEGMALIKLTGITFVGMFIPFFITGKYQYVFAVLPSYWMGKVMISYGTYQFVLDTFLGILCSSGWIAVFYREFKRKKP